MSQPDTTYRKAMEAALADYKAKYGGMPKFIMLGEDVWRERADDIAESMNRTGDQSTVVVCRAKAGNGVLCTEERCDIPTPPPTPTKAEFDPFSL